MDIDLKRKERVRGYILKILTQDYPNGMDSSVIYYALNEGLGFSMDRTAFNFHIGYLLEKKLIRDEKKTAGKNISLHIIAITSHGLDVMDGRVSECGVDTEI